LQVENTQVTSNGLTFRTITSTGSTTNGIRLANTGTAATTTLRVSGTGTADSGGIISGSTGPGISLDTVKGVSLTRVKVQNAGDDGVNAANLNGFTLANSVVQNNGNAANENGLDFTNLSGTVDINNTTVSGNSFSNVVVANNTGTANITLTTVTVTGAVTNNGVDIETTTAGASPANVTVNVPSSPSPSTFSNNAATGFMCSGTAASGAATGSTLACNILGATFTGNNIGMDIDQSNNAHVTFDVEGNTLNNHFSHAMNFFANTTLVPGAQFTGKILNNTIGTASSKDSGSAIGSGLRFIAQGKADTAVRIAGNTIREIPNAVAVDIQGRLGDGGLDVTVLNNTVTAPTGTNQTVCDGSTTTMCPG